MAKRQESSGQAGEEEGGKPSSPLIAKKAHVLEQNDFKREIQEGDDVSDVPAHLLAALRSEGVID